MTEQAAGPLRRNSPANKIPARGGGNPATNVSLLVIVVEKQLSTNNETPLGMGRHTIGRKTLSNRTTAEIDCASVVTY
jgi:hypothetical protein